MTVQDGEKFITGNPGYRLTLTNTGDSPVEVMEWNLDFYNSQGIVTDNEEGLATHLLLIPPGTSRTVSKVYNNPGGPQPVRCSLASWTK